MNGAGPRGPGAAPDHVAVGEVLGAFGVRGQVRVRPLTDFPERLLELERVRVKRPGALARAPEWRAVSASEAQGDGHCVLTLEGVSSREAAGALSGSFLEIEAAEVKPLPPDRYYRFQLLGLEARDESGRALGRVSDVLETGANDVFVIMPEGGRGPRDELLLPAVRDVVLRIDTEAGVLVVRPQPSWGDRP